MSLHFAVVIVLFCFVDAFVLFCFVFFLADKVVFTHINLSLFERGAMSKISP